MTWYGRTDLPVTSFKQMFEVTLGKMLQTEPTGPTDSLTPYLNSAAVQDGYVEDSNLKFMWASDSDRRNLSVRANDLVVCEGGDVGRSALVKADSSAVFQNSVHRVRPRRGNDIRFAKYTLDALRSSSYLDVLCNKATIRHFTADKLANLEVPHSNPGYQNAACDYLDRETAQIDDLIGMQERLIDLLAEKRQAVITHAVTKGLDPSAPTKPSGIPWLGDIPAAWKVSKLSWETRGIGDGLHGTPTYSDQGSIPFVNGTNLLGGEIRITDSTNFVEEDQLSGTDMDLDESTVLISINGTIGNCAVLGNRQVMLSKSAAFIKCSESLDVHFLAHYLRSHPTRSYFFATSGGTTIANLSLAALRGTPIPVLPLPMQEEITKWLNEQIQSFDELGSKAYEAARLLRERRSALISAAVTGKIDVRKEPS